MDKNCKGDHNCQHRDRDAQTVVDCGDGTCGKMTGPTFGNQPLLLCAPKFDAGEKPGCKQKDGNTICRCVNLSSGFTITFFKYWNYAFTQKISCKICFIYFHGLYLLISIL